MDNITFACPGCGKRYTQAAQMVGRRVRCKKCDRTFSIPGEAPRDTPPEEALYQVADEQPAPPQPPTPMPPSPPPGRGRPESETRPAYPERLGKIEPRRPPVTAPDLRKSLHPSALIGIGVVLGFLAGVVTMSFVAGRDSGSGIQQKQSLVTGVISPDEAVEKPAPTAAEEAPRSESVEQIAAEKPVQPADTQSPQSQEAIAASPAPPTTDARPPASTSPMPTEDRSSPPADPSVPALVYKWKPGESYVYGFEISIDAGTVIVEYQGGSIYRVKSSDKDGMTLGHRAWMVTRRRGKDGRAVPGGVSGPSKTGQEVELKVDPKGALISSSGTSPLPVLGDLSMLVIDPFPDGTDSSWETSQAITLNEIQQMPGVNDGVLRLGRPDLGGLRSGPKSRSQSRAARGSRPGSLRSRLAGPAPTRGSPAQVKVTSHAAQEQTDYSIGTREGEVVPISKKYEMMTEEMVGDEPRLKMTGEGMMRFDLETGVPIAVDFRAQVVENTPNITVRVPVRVNCRLLGDEERDQALRPKVIPATAMNPIAAAELERVLADLQAKDPDRRGGACRLLFDSAPIEERRSDVARALEKLLADRDQGLRHDAIRALGVWGDSQSTDRLLEHLKSDPDGARDPIFEALGRLEPDESVVGVAVAWLEKDPDRATNLLQANGKLAERPLLQLVQRGTDTSQRLRACQILRDIGSSESVPILEEIARQKDAGEAARIAEESARQIAHRYPEDAEWQTILRDVKSADGGTRRRAADRLLECGPTEERRPDAVRALEPLSGDADEGTQIAALQALASWGGLSSRALILSRVSAPKFRPNREVMDAVIGLGPPDEDLARAMTRWLDVDRGLAIEGLATGGTAAESSIVDRIGKEKDAGIRYELCNILSNVGTAASLPKLNSLATSDEDGNVKNAAKHASREIEARTSPDRWAETLAADLKSPDHERCKQAVERLAAMKWENARREEIARGLEALLDDKDVFMRRSLMRAIANWGDLPLADALGSLIDRQKDLGEWQEALRSLARLRPDERTAQIALRRLPYDDQQVEKILRRLGPLGERAVVNAAQAADDGQVRIAASRALGRIGTPSALPELRELAMRAGDEQVGQEAEGALNAIKARQ